jgi:hypothetical protein
VYRLSDFLNVSFLWFLFHLLLFAAAEAGKKLTCGRQARAERQITISLRLGAFARVKIRPGGRDSSKESATAEF